MNEMKQLEDLCAAVPPPGAERLSATRTRVLRAASTGAGETQARRGRLVPRGPAPRRLITPPRLALTGGIAAVAAAAAALALISPAAPKTGVRVQLDAAVVLHRAAAAALATPAPGPGQFLYIDVRAVGHGGRHAYRQQMWLSSVSGPHQGTIRQTPCAAWPGPQCVLVDTQIRGDWASPTYAWVKTLPSDPAALLAYLEHHSPCTFSVHQVDTPHAAYSEVYSILNSVYVLPGKFGAALFDATAQIPGVRVLRHVTDAAGGRGIAVALTGRATVPVPASPAPFGPALRYELIFNPHTYRFIGLQAVTPGGAVENAASVTSAQVAGRAPRTHSIAMWGDQTSCLA